ncbi:MAG TPA: hypothetical protein VF989_18295 [Polyangiaceae bacterium]|jgi:hypothetical protein
MTGDEARKERVKPLAERPADPPVVARMVVEIRSDGTRTVARGAIEDLATGESASLEAHGTTPIALAASLAKSLVSIPFMARGALRSWAARHLLPSRREPK